MEIQQRPISLLGVPWDKKSSFLQGPALAPDKIRATLHNGAGNYWTELTSNPIESDLLIDKGNITISSYLDISKPIADELAQGNRTLCLGGDHSMTYPIISAYAQYFQSFDILQIDAHGDLYHEFEGDPHSHACPFARIVENKLCHQLIQVGIRTLNPHQREQANKFGVQLIEMKDFEEGARPTFTRPIYISLDLDGLDPAFAPGVSHHEPGGLTTREVLRLLQSIKVPIIGADIVEYNPHRDVSDMTAAVAAKFLKEIAGKMVENRKWRMENGEFLGC